jgi:integrase
MAVLSQRAVEAARPDPAKRVEVPDGALPGFYLVVQPSGAKSWAVRYRADGKPRKLTLGAFPRLGLAQARDRAREALAAASEGRDPAGEKLALAREVDTAAQSRFGHVAAEFVEKYARPRNRTWRQTEVILTKGDLGPWQARDIRTIGRRDVLDVVDAIVKRGAAVQANRVFAALRRFFRWAVERGVIEASPMVGLRAPSPETSRDRVLDDTELAAIWRAADAIGYPFGRAVQLAILTGQRRAEVLEAEWAEFDIEGRTWTIPRARAKNDTAHAVPLSDPAMDLLAGLMRVGAPPRYLFTTTGETPFSGISKATDRLERLAAGHMPGGEPIAPWRLHDLRRTYASGCARLGIPVHVVERALNHVSGTFGGIVGVYQRHTFLDERRDAMKAWAGHVLGLVSERPSNVVPLAVAR